MIIWIDQLAEAGLISADSDLTTQYLEFMEEIAFYLDFGRKGSTGAGLTTAQEKACLVYLNGGYKNFLNAWDWPFLRPVVSKTAWATATGTTSGTPSYDGESGSIVTATAAKFYDTMVGRSFTFDTSSTSYTITGYQSTTVIEVSGDASGEASGDTFTITANGLYRMPGDFGGILGDLTFQADEGFYAPLQIRSESQVRTMLQTSTDAGRPIFAALRAAETDGTIGQRYDLMTYPIPDADYPLSFQMNVLVDSINVNAGFPYGNMAHSETIKAAIIAYAEVSTRETRGVRWQEYQDRLAESIRRERYANTPERLGYNGDLSDVGRNDIFERSKIVTVGGLSFP